jgi:hypothetical protein
MLCSMNEAKSMAIRDKTNSPIWVVMIGATTTIPMIVYDEVRRFQEHENFRRRWTDLDPILGWTIDDGGTSRRQGLSLIGMERMAEWKECRFGNTG